MNDNRPPNPIPPLRPIPSEEPARPIPSDNTKSTEPYKRVLPLSGLSIFVAFIWTLILPLIMASEAPLYQHALYFLPLLYLIGVRIEHVKVQQSIQIENNSSSRLKEKIFVNRCTVAYAIWCLAWGIRHAFFPTPKHGQSYITLTELINAPTAEERQQLEINYGYFIIFLSLAFLLYNGLKKVNGPIKSY